MNIKVKGNSELKKIKPYASEKFLICTGFFAFCIVTSALKILVPYLFSKLLSKAQREKINILSVETIFPVFLFFVEAILSAIQERTLIIRKNSKVKNLSKNLLLHILRTEKSAFENKSVPYFTARIIDEANNIDGILYLNIISGLVDLISLIVFFAILLSANYLFAFATVALIAVDYTISLKIPISKAYREYGEYAADLKAKTSNILYGSKQIKLGLTYETETRLFSREITNLLHASYRRDKLRQAMQIASKICKQFGYIYLILLSATEVSKGLKIGDFAFLISIYNLMWSASVSAGNLIPLFKLGKVTINRFDELLNMSEEPTETKNSIQGMVYSIGMRNVDFQYDPSRKILQGFSFTANLGQITSIAGYSGAGKSTVFNLLMGFYEVNNGNLLINNENVSRDVLVASRNIIGSLDQQPFLFNRTIKENVLYFAEESEESIAEVCHYIYEFGLSDLIASLPGGLDYMLTEKSTTISTGEMQRLCIIRELMKHPAILLLDEATAHLDSTSEKKVFDILRKMSSHIIVVQIAHKPSALSYSDIVYVVSRGTISESGTHEQLISTSYTYNKIINQP